MPMLGGGIGLHVNATVGMRSERLAPNAATATRRGIACSMDGRTALKAARSVAHPNISRSQTRRRIER